MKVQLGVKDIWQLLNGVLCVYKPRDLSLSALKRLIINRIVEEGNSYDDKSVPMIEVPIVEPHRITQALVVVGKQYQLDYSQHPLMVGRAFHPDDIMMEPINDLQPASSGVCAFTIGPECYKIDEHRAEAWINTYRLVGKLGEETEKHNIRSKVVVKAEWEHVTRHHLQKLLSRIRAQYKKMAFQLANVDLQSQEAFELARKGAPRPKILNTPVVYNANISHFQTPFFGLQLQVTGETDYFLRAFIHELGISLGTTACTKQLRCIRMDALSMDCALLDKELNLTNIIRNIIMCNKALELAKQSRQTPVIKVRKVADLESNAVIESFKNISHVEETEEEDCLRIPWGRDYNLCV